VPYYREWYIQSGHIKKSYRSIITTSASGCNSSLPVYLAFPFPVFCICICIYLLYSSRFVWVDYNHWNVE
jgi:hypothetical protein